MAGGRIWADKELEILKAMVPRGYTAQAIVDELERNGYTRTAKQVIQKKYDMKRRGGVSQPAPIEIGEDETAIDAVTNMRDAATLGITKWHETHIHRDLNRDLKILSLSDLHIPFFYGDVVEDALTKHTDADVVVLNGDTLEMDAASRFPRHKTVLLKYEYKLALQFLARLSKQFKNIVIVKGNHEDRLDRYFADKIDPALNMMVESDVLWRLANGYGFNQDGFFERHYDFNNVSYERGVNNWFVQIGQAIFCHPSRTSSMTCRSVELAHQYFMSRGYSYQAVIMGHTHRLASCVTDGKLLIEQGCMCVPLDYAAKSDIKYKPTSFGYAVVVMDEHGNVDFNESHPVYYGTGSTTPCHSLEVS